MSQETLPIRPPKQPWNRESTTLWKLLQAIRNEYVPPEMTLCRQILDDNGDIDPKKRCNHYASTGHKCHFAHTWKELRVPKAYEKKKLGREKYGDQTILVGNWTGWGGWVRVPLAEVYVTKLTHETVLPEITNEASGAVARVCYNWLFYGKCFPSDCTRVLTDRGFLFLSEIEGFIQRNEEVLFAAFEQSTQSIKFVPGKLVYPNGRSEVDQDFIEFTDETGRKSHWGDDSGHRCPSIIEETSGEPDHAQSNQVSLLVTPEHDMFVQLGNRSGSKVEVAMHTVVVDGKMVQQPLPPSKKAAEDLVFDATRDKPGAAMRFTAHAPNGFAGDEVQLGAALASAGITFDSVVKRNAFVELYFFWVGDGSMEFSNGRASCVTFGNTEHDDVAWLKQKFAEIGLVESLDWSEGEQQLLVKNGAIVTFFEQACGSRYKRHEDYDGDGTHLKSVKWLMEWVWYLGKDLLVPAIEALRRADGSDGDKCIFTSCPKLRDDLLSLMVRAGYTAFFVRYRKKDDELRITNPKTGVTNTVHARADGWKVAYSAHESVTHPNLGRQGEVTRVTRKSVAWCVTVGHDDHLIVAQRAERDCDGVTTKASRPIIVGQCWWWESCNFLHPDVALYRSLCKSLMCCLGDNERPCQVALCPYAHRPSELSAPRTFIDDDPAAASKEGELLVSSEKSAAPERVSMKYVCKTDFVESPGQTHFICEAQGCDLWAECQSVHLRPSWWRDHPDSALPVHPYLEALVHKRRDAPTLLSKPAPWATASGAAVIKKPTPAAPAPPASGPAPPLLPAKASSPPPPPVVVVVPPAPAQAVPRPDPLQAFLMERFMIPMPPMPQLQAQAQPLPELPSSLSVAVVEDPRMRPAPSGAPRLESGLTVQNYLTFPDMPPLNLGAHRFMPSVRYDFSSKWFRDLSGRWEGWLGAMVSFGEFRKIGNMFFHPKCKLSSSGGRVNSNVYLGLMEDGQAVAVKVLKEEEEQSPEEIESERLWKTEITTLLRRNCIHGIVHMISSARETNIGPNGPESLRVLALELMQGSVAELAETWKKTGLIGTPQHYRAVQYIVNSALATLFELSRLDLNTHTRTIHRDIKPQNIMVDKIFQVRLIDFGAAKELSETEDERVTHTTAYTLTYAAPEVLRVHAPHVTSDLWSLGLVLAYLLTGEEKWDIFNAATVVPNDDYVKSNVFLASNPHLKANVIHLLSLMVRENAKTRAYVQFEHIGRDDCHENLLRHPFFWDSRRATAFLVALGNSTNRLSQYQKSLLNEALRPAIWAHCWKELITDPYMIQKIATVPDHPYLDEPVGLLRFIRNCHEHYSGPKDSMFLDGPYFLHLFPEAVTRLWECCVHYPSITERLPILIQFVSAPPSLISLHSRDDIFSPWL